VDENCAAGACGKETFMPDDNLAIFSFQRLTKINAAPRMEVSGA